MVIVVKKTDFNPVTIDLKLIFVILQSKTIL